MSAGKLNITVEQGATFQKTLIYKDSAGALIDLSNVTEARAQMRPTVASGTAYDFEVVVDDDPTTGKIHWSMAAAVTATVVATALVYDLELEFDDGTVKRLIEGSVVMVPEVTRS